MLPKIHRLFVNEELQLFRQLGRIPMASIISSLVTPSLWLVSNGILHSHHNVKQLRLLVPEVLLFLHLVLPQRRHWCLD
jgi:hypothetical protein